MDIRPFTAQDLAAYATWFEDTQLAAALGPAPDVEWLAAVLHDADRQYAARVDNPMTMAY